MEPTYSTTVHVDKKRKIDEGDENLSITEIRPTTDGEGKDVADAEQEVDRQEVKAELAEAEILRDENRKLRSCLGLPEVPGPYFVPYHHNSPAVRKIFVEIGPASHHDVMCCLSTCHQIIQANTYRIAVPLEHTAILYHVHCFFKFANSADYDILQRIWGLTRSNYWHRNLQPANVINGDFLVDGGGEKLVLFWKTQRQKWVMRSYSQVLPIPPITDPLENLVQLAGKSDYVHKPGAFVTWYEEFLLLNILKPFESDGPEDREEWSLRSTYLDQWNNMEALQNNHTLTLILERWMYDKVMACSVEASLVDDVLTYKEMMGPKMIRAVKRLSAVPLPLPMNCGECNQLPHPYNGLPVKLDGGTPGLPLRVAVQKSSGPLVKDDPC